MISSVIRERLAQLYAARLAQLESQPVLRESAKYARKRKAALRQATPPWANLRSIEKIYAQARAMTRRKRINHQVDHLFPIQGRLVCGLHVEENLRIITQRDNSRKGNRQHPNA